MTAGRRIKRARTARRTAIAGAAALILLPVAVLGGDVVTRGEMRASLAPFDDLMTSFLAEHDVAGAALAVARRGRLVLARGYGFADRERQIPVEPDALFRIASISKPVTAVAVLRLVEAGKLRLEDRVDALLGIAPHLEPGGAVDPRLREVTILQLLRHTAGFDRDASFDPMFRPLEIAAALGVPPPAAAEHVMRYMWGRRLDFDPGARYAYSNFGYCLLGRVIERVAGKPYGAFVHEEVLAPLGIRRMRLGRTLARDRAPGEVAYHAPGVAFAVTGAIGRETRWPDGGFYLEAMDAHGGWIASAVDLVRFASAFDDPERCPLLEPESIELMFERPPGLAGHEEDGAARETYYGCGWNVRPQGAAGANHWHTGSLPGTSTILVRRRDGFSWAVLFNQRRPGKRADGAPAKNLAVIIDPLVHEAADAVRRWPDVDLFPRFLESSTDGGR